MAVLPADLELRLTTNNLGGAKLVTVSDGTDIWDAFTGQETTDGATEYACLYVHNDAAQTALAAKVNIEGETSHAGVNVSIGLGSSAVDGTEQTIADKNTAPAGVTFSEAEDLANALSIGDLATGAHKAIWLRIVIGAGTAAKNSYLAPIQITADTEE